MKTATKHHEEAHTHEHTEHERAHEHEKHEARKEAEEKARHVKAPEKKPSGVPYLLFGIIIVVLVGIIIFLLLYKPGAPGSGPGSAGGTETETYAGEKVPVEFYVMSQCPYGTQVMDGIAPVMEQIGDAVDLQINYILYPITNYAGRETQYCIQELCSMHGVAEVKGDIVELCAMKYNPDLYLKMITCMDENSAQIPANWETCAQDNKLDVAKIKACYEGDEGIQLLRASAAKADERQATGSPTIYINNQQYSGGRDATAFQRAICAYSNHTECTNLPEPTKVELTVLNDKRCTDCVGGVAQLVSQLKSLFPGLEVKEMDYSSQEGKELYTSLKIKYLPVMLFTDSVEKGEGYAQVKNYLEPIGEYSSLRIGADFDPTAEICDNEIDDTGDGKIDCADPTCTNSLVCRSEIKQKIDLFIMSDCPYGRMAVLALEEVVANFKDKLTFEIHYIASENADGTFNSLHGAYEVEEDMRQLCVLKHTKDKWFDYITCRSENAVRDTAWDACAKTAGLTDAEKTSVTNCVSGEEGKTLLSEDIRTAESLQVSASPTWFANNKYQFSGIAAEVVKTNYCKYNPGLAGCETDLTTDTSVPEGSC